MVEHPRTFLNCLSVHLWRASAFVKLPRSFLARLFPSPAVMERGKGGWGVAPGVACGLIWCICGAYAPYFFWLFSFLPPLRPGVEPADTVFKNVQITLNFVRLSS